MKRFPKSACMAWFAAALLLMLNSCGTPAPKVDNAEKALPAAPPEKNAVSEATFAAEVEQYKDAVLVDFWAPWCGPCRMVSPILEELSTEMKQVKLVKVNVDDNQNLAERFKVQSIPLMVLFKDGKEVDRIVGAASKDKIKSWLEAQLAK